MRGLFVCVGLSGAQATTPRGICRYVNWRFGTDWFILGGLTRNNGIVNPADAGNMSLQSLLNEEQSGVLQFGGARMALLDIESGFWGLRRQMEALVGRELTDNAMQQAGANGGASFARAFSPAVTGKPAQSAFRDCVAAYQAAGFGVYEVEVSKWPIGRVLVHGKDTFESWMMRQHKQAAAKPACAYTAGVLVGFINALTDRRDIVCIQHSCRAQGDETCLFELLPTSDAERTAVVAFDPDLRLYAQSPTPILTQQAGAFELSALLAISENVASTLDLDPLLGLILEQFQAVVAYKGAAILALEGAKLRVLAYRGPIPQDVVSRMQFPLAQAGANKAVIERREPMIIPDVRGDSELAHAFQTMAGDRLMGTFGYIRSWMGVPLIARDQIIGMLSIDHDQPDFYTGRHSLLAQTFANKVALAIENARLYRDEQERRRELQMLLDVAATANSSLDLDEMLRTSLDRLVSLVGASRAGVLLLDEDSGALGLRMLRPERALAEEDLETLVDVGRSIIAGGEPLYVQVNPEKGLHEPGAFIPLRSHDHTLGLLGIIGVEGSEFTQGQLLLFNSIADQLAVAVENARLYGQVERAAAAAERNRLARDLHDAVSQTLFSASLIAEVVPRLWERNPDEGRRRLEELRELTRGALAEMRALLMELRPATLTEVSLANLLRQLAEATTGRARLPVDLQVEGDRPLPLEVKVAFYRIAQEALNNISKHAGADSVVIHLHTASDVMQMVIRDNGRGFSAGDVPPNSLGVGIMRERAARVGADFLLESQMGEGTAVTVTWPSEEK